MKRINKIFLGLGSLALLSSGALAITLASNPKDAVQANAASGSVSVYLNQWSTAGDIKLAIYFYIANTETNQWSNFVDVDEDQEFVTVNYDVGFTPTHMIAARFDANATVPGWNSDKYNQTNDLAISGHISITDWDNSAISGYPVVEGGNPWGQIAELNQMKINSSSHCEYYGQVTLTNESFKSVFGGGYYNSYTTHASISSNFQIGGAPDYNIDTLVSGTYKFYFDSVTHSTHITTPVISAADEWSDSFLKNVGCDPQGVNLPTGWSTVAASYAAITDGDVKDYIYSMAADSDSAASSTAKAVYQYDWAVAHHPELEKFIKDSHNNVRTPHIVAGNSPISFTNEDAGKVIATVVIVSLVAVTAIGGIIIIRKKEQH